MIPVIVWASFLLLSYFKLRSVSFPDSVLIIQVLRASGIIKKTRDVFQNDLEARFFQFVNNIVIPTIQIQDTVEVAAQSKACEASRLEN